MYGERIKGRRQALGLTWKNLSSKIEVPIARLMAWEAEQESPSIQELISLSKALMVSIDWLVGAVELPYGYSSDEDTFFEGMLDEMDYDDYSDLDPEDEEESFDEEASFQVKIMEHMKDFTDSHNGSVYVHIALSEDEDNEDCIMYAGEPAAIITVINILIDRMAITLNMNYYDLIAKMATNRTKNLDFEDY